MDGWSKSSLSPTAMRLLLRVGLELADYDAYARH
jgi:hypothetical protein